MAKFQEFRELAEKLPVVSIADLNNAMPGLRRETIYRWHRSGKIEIVAPGYYIIPGFLTCEQDLYAAANRIYSPSFVSLESALSYHGLIPESALSVTSVSTRKTRTVLSPFGKFMYRTVKPGYWFGYSVLEGPRHSFLMAAPERALADLLYLRRDIQCPDDLRELRLNRDAFCSIADRLLETAARFDKKWLSEKCEMLLKVMKNA